MIELNAIERSCNRDLGGLKALSLIDPNDLESQPDWYLLPDVSELVFLPGKGPYNFQAILHTARLEDETNPDNIQGDFFQYRLTAQIKGLRGEVDLLRAKLRNRRVHVLATFKDDTMRLVPDMRLSAKGDSGAKTSDRNGYTFTGTSQLDRPAPWVGGSYSIIGGPPDTGGAGGSGDVAIIAETTTDSTYTYAVPAGSLLLAVYVSGSADQEISVGTTNGGSELGGPVPLEASAPNNKATFETVFRAPSSTNIYITGLSGTNTIEIWLIA